MGLDPDHQDEMLLNDDLGRLLRKSLQARVERMPPPARGREQLFATLRSQQVEAQKYRGSLREEFQWLPPPRPDQTHSDHDVWSALIHARDSVRRLSL
jgi:hypothetical protein